MNTRPTSPQRAALLQTPAGQAMHQKAVREVKEALAAHGIELKEQK
jgi:hypothetical protein